MCSQYTYQAACKLASQMGAAIVQDHDDWTRAVGFPSPEVAWCFQTQFNGMDSVGAFREQDGNGYSVVFRQGNY